MVGARRSTSRASESAARRTSPKPQRGSLTRVDAEIEVDRYTVWPGQALAYKLGQREIERARAEVAERMGDRFDLRAFHDEVLGHGSLPLATLRREILTWVEAAVETPA